MTTGDRTRLHIVCGNAGVGKTTYGAKLAQDLSGALLDIDTASERLVRVGLAGYGLPEDDRDSPRYKELFREAIHETLWLLARDCLASVPVVVVAPFTQERRQVTFPRRVEERLGVAVTVHYLWCRETDRKVRIVRRGNPRDAGKIAEWDSFSAHGQDPSRPPFEHIFVDTSERTELS